VITEGSNPTDELELELRQLAGVSFVGFGQRGAAVLVEVGVQPGADRAVVTEAARRVAAGHLAGEVVVEVTSPPRPAPVAAPSGPPEGWSQRPDLRVQLVLTVLLSETPEVELHLAHAGRRVAVVATLGDRRGTARATIDGLTRLGFHVPFSVEWAEPLTVGEGDGTIVVLRHSVTGELRRGLSTARTTEESGARAVLNALNRYLQPRQGARRG
jgi:hypothetical protein